MVLPFKFIASTFTHLLRSTEPFICGKLKQPSISISFVSLNSVITGLINMTSLSHFDRSPDSLYTIKRLLIPTCGAANPTPCAAYMMRNISRAILAILPFWISSKVTISFLARNDACGYFNIRKSVPSTTPGSTSSPSSAGAVVTSSSRLVGVDDSAFSNHWGVTKGYRPPLLRLK